MKETKKTDPRILRTRQLIRDAFVQLLQEKDIEKITVNSIAERATINRVTFYLHYRDIPDMLEKMADEMIEDIVQALSSTPIDENAEDGVNGPKMVQFIEHIAEQAEFYKVILATKRTPIFMERLLELVTEMMEENLEKEGDRSFISKASIPTDIAMWYISSALFGTIIGWLRNDMPYSAQYLAKQFYQMLPGKGNKEERGRL